MFLPNTPLSHLSHSRLPAPPRISLSLSLHTRTTSNTHTAHLALAHNAHHALELPENDANRRVDQRIDATPPNWHCKTTIIASTAVAIVAIAIAIAKSIRTGGDRGCLGGGTADNLERVAAYDNQTAVFGAPSDVSENVEAKNVPNLARAPSDQITERVAREKRREGEENE